MGGLYIRYQMKRKISDEEIEEKILKIFDEARWSPLSISEVTLKLKKGYNIGLSPQVVKRYLFKLKKEGKIK